MKYFQYTGSQPETGMVVMEVEMVSGTNFYQFSMILLMLILMLMLMVSSAEFYRFSINVYPLPLRFFFILFPFKRTLRWEAKTNSS